MMQAARQLIFPLITALILAAPAVRAQDMPPTETLRVDVPLVQLTCSAFDRKTHVAVPIASAQQLRVLQDGQLQSKVTLRPAADLPLTLGILLDTSGSEAGEWNMMRAQTLRFLQDTLRPGDRVLILTFDDKLKLLQDLTSATTAPVDVLSALSAIHDNKTAPEVGQRKKVKGNTRAWDAIAFAEDRLAPLQGRKALVILSDGIDNASIADRHQIIREAQNQGLVFYGLYVHSAMNVALTAIDPLFLADRRFSEMIDQTGGRLFNAMTSATAADRLAQIAAILRSQFTLEYHPEPLPAPGFHRIRVDPIDAALQVRTRSGVWQ